MWVSCLTQVPGLPPVVGAPGHFLHTRYCPERMAARPRGRGGGKGRGRGGRGRSELARGGKGRGRGGRGRGRLARHAVLKSNARKAARKAALRQLNDLAEELGLNPVSLKRARAAEVEQVARSLQMRQLSADHAARLRSPFGSLGCEWRQTFRRGFGRGRSRRPAPTSLGRTSGARSWLSLGIEGLHADVQQ